PTKATDLILVTDNKNTVNLNSLKNLGFDVSENDQIKFNKLVGKTFKVVANNDYYQELPNGMFIPKKVTSSMYNNAKTKLILVGVIRPKNEDSMALLSTGIAYSDKLSQEVINDNKNSDVVKAQKKTNRSVLTNQKLNANEKKMTMQTLGGSSIPTGIMIYPNNFDDKDKVLDYLDKWNKGKKKADKIVYTDMSNAVTTMTGGLLNGITTILVAFAAISLITSMIMIGILTYTSVLERTKEIGVLKALGARKKDITRVFDAETFILGVFSGVLGIFIAYLLTFPINTVIYNITDLANVAQLDPKAAIILIIVSTVLTLLGGHIPARMAAKKDAAIALRSE
nr:FtsX-like permease family protein [Lactobacillus amylovorus]